MALNLNDIPDDFPDATAVKSDLLERSAAVVSVENQVSLLNPQSTPVTSAKLLLSAPVKRKSSPTSGPLSKRRKLSYPPRTRSGMTAAVDTAYQKRGYNSLTGKNN